MTIATDIGIPRSTTRGWLAKAPKGVVSLDMVDRGASELQHEVFELRRRVKKLTALLRLDPRLASKIGIHVDARASARGARQIRILRAGWIVPVTLFCCGALSCQKMRLHGVYFSFFWTEGQKVFTTFHHHRRVRRRRASAARPLRPGASSTEFAPDTWNLSTERSRWGCCMPPVRALPQSRELNTVCEHAADASRCPLARCSARSLRSAVQPRELLTARSHSSFARSASLAWELIFEAGGIRSFS